MGGVGAEKLGEPMGAGAEIVQGLLGGGKGAMDGLRDLFGLAAGAEGRIPGRGPDLSAGVGGFFGGGRDSVTGGAPDPFAGQGKNPLGEGAGRGPDPRVGATEDHSLANDFSDTMDAWAAFQGFGGGEAEDSELASIGSEAMGAMPDQGSPLLNAIARVAVAQQTNVQADPEDQKLVDDAAKDLSGDTGGDDTEGGDTEGGDTEGGDTEGDDTEGGDTDGGDTEGGDIETVDQGVGWATPNPEGGDGQVGSPKQQAELNAIMTFATAKHRDIHVNPQGTLLGDTREAGSTKSLGAMVAVQQAAAFGNRLGPQILTDDADADLGLTKEVPKQVNTLIDPVRESLARRGPKPKP